jgi:glutamate racemase
MSDSQSRPIGFFDSGLGGLTVLRTVRASFPNENLVYLGDTARLPYGTKSSETIRRYTMQSIAALLKLNVKAVVVACNSASTSLLDSQDAVTAPVPLYNVIEPGAEAALRVSLTKRIGVIATRATVLSNAYRKAILAKDENAFVTQQPAPLLVALVEEGWESDPITNLIIYRYVVPVLSEKIDTLILGCTHYPALREGIARAVGTGIELVDSAQAISDGLKRDFESGRLEQNKNPTRGRLELFATDASPAMDQTAKRLMHDPDLPVFQSCDL